MQRMCASTYMKISQSVKESLGAECDDTADEEQEKIKDLPKSQSLRTSSELIRRFSGLMSGEKHRQQILIKAVNRLV